MAEHRSRRALLSGVSTLALLAGLSLAAPLASGDPRHIDLAATLTAPSPAHWCGTDVLGRDVAARIAHGGRTSLAIGLLTGLLALAFGVPLGALAGYRGGLADAAISRAIEALICFPSIVLLVALTAAPPAWIRGIAEVPRLALTLAVVGWIPIARYVRADVLRLRAADVTTAARAIGAADPRVIVRHVLPGAIAPALVTAAFTVSAAIAVEGALTFLGLGVSPDVPTWGGILSDAREHVHHAWWLTLFPGLALFVTVLACSLVGEGLRERLDPRR